MALAPDDLYAQGPSVWGFPESFIVETHRRETPGVVTLGVRPVAGRTPTFAPGQFNMVSAAGVGEVPISIAGTTPSGIMLHTIRDVGPVTRALCGARPGSALGVRGPFGTSWGIDRAEGRDVVVIAGGIGLAPLRPAIEAVIAARHRYGRITVLAGARTPELILYPRLLARWRSRFDVHVGITVDTAGHGWAGDVGLVTELLDRAPFDPATAWAFVCGPEVMMRAAGRSLVDHGVGPDRIRVSLERNMKCGIGLCGHCQLGPAFVCLDGPVFPFDRALPLMSVREL